VPSGWNKLRRIRMCEIGHGSPAQWQEKYMKTKKQDVQTLPVSDAAWERDVQQEIDSFLRALSSYPDRFAREPYLSFQQHLSSIVTAAHSRSTSEDRRRPE
jgi:hypothetical protein